MRLSHVRLVLVSGVLMLLSSGAYADSKSLPPMAAVKDVTASTPTPPDAKKGPWQVLTAGGTWCAAKDGVETVTITFADPTQLDGVKLAGTGAAKVEVSAD